MGIFDSATPNYLKREGYPKHPEDLKHHNCLNCRNRKTGGVVPWFFSINGQTERFLVTGNLTIDDGEAVGKSLLRASASIASNSSIHRLYDKTRTHRYTIKP